MFNDRSVAITGGTGAFGRKLVEALVSRYKTRRLVIFSRDELKQYEMAQTYSPGKYPEMRYFIGDVRDYERVNTAFQGIDYVIHAAAIKHIAAAEYNPFETIKTNVLGTQNVIRACIECGVKRAIAISTDKAAAPINLYGATKLCADKLFVAANSMSGGPEPKFSVVRYGSIWGSSDGVVPLFLVQKKEGLLTITDDRMTRFSICLDNAVDFTVAAFAQMNGGEIFVPRMPSYRIVDLAKAIAPEIPTTLIGMRPGERLHETIIPLDESWHTLEFNNHYQILPVDQWRDSAIEMLDERACPCAAEFSYCSNDNDWFLSVAELKHMVHSNVLATLNNSSRQWHLRIAQD